MNGEVSATSVYGKGSEFTCTIRLATETDQQVLMEKDNSFDRHILYFAKPDEPLVNLDYLNHISSEVSVYSIEEMNAVLAPYLANTEASPSSEHTLGKHIILMDIENGKEARILHETISALRHNEISFASVTNTQPEQLRTILKSQWECPIISHPFTPTQFFLFANQMYGKDTFFAGHSNDLADPNSQTDANASKRSINTTLYQGHVLLVEDNSINQMVAGEMLHSFGITFDIAEDGQQALTKVENSPYYDLILMDIQMPVMDGNEATQAIRKAGHTDIPIIGLSANAMKHDYAHAKDSGMNEYLTKPIKRETLRKTLSKFLKERDGPGTT
jgi:CheY-like chemotaxis protein